MFSFDEEPCFYVSKVILYDIEESDALSVLMLVKSNVDFSAFTSLRSKIPE